MTAGARGRDDAVDPVLFERETFLLVIGHPRAGHQLVEMAMGVDPHRYVLGVDGGIGAAGRFAHPYEGRVGVNGAGLDRPHDPELVCRMANGRLAYTIRRDLTRLAV